MSNAHEITFDKDADLPIEATPVPVPTASSSMSNRKKQSNRRHEQLPRFGNLPDIYWRAISMDHLRMHPKFDALPAHVGKLDCLEDVRNFRQDSWQWDALHAGRCTTSQASAALGFLEPEAAAVLQIPKSWQRCWCLPSDARGCSQDPERHARGVPCRRESQLCYRSG
ncbi:hypothetical protein MHU86_11114 [Fragilaria crotonensis]|nr:hypothetical protein MHU86_11114 [Fragilaria crotonensis]